MGTGKPNHYRYHYYIYVPECGDFAQVARTMLGRVVL